MCPFLLFSLLSCFSLPEMVIKIASLKRLLARVTVGTLDGQLVQQPLEHQIGRGDGHLVDGLSVQRAHGVDLEVGVQAGVAEGVGARRVDRLDKGLQADLAHQVLVDVARVVVEVGLVVGMVLAARPF